MSKIVALALALMALASCGGDSGSDEYQAALAQAEAAQAQAVALAATSPCNAVQQCGVLTLSVASGRCTFPDYHVYSLVSATAGAASDAAANERTLAQRAVSLAPPTSCVEAVEAPPGVACVANTCQAALSQ
jgi:hypothetical protein